MSGNLYIIAGPIGNLEDFTFRAVRILRDEISFICCEDTRQTKKLTNHYEIQKPLISFHSHSTDNQLQKLCERILVEDAAYLTDCGTPGVSDPGSKLVNTAMKMGIRIIPIPGPSALTALASSTGFAGKNLVFTGFISKKPGRRISELTELKQQKGTIIVYESPHRIIKTINAIAEVFPDSTLAIGRELTKIHEEIIIGKAAELITNGKIKEKGEFAIAIDNN